MNNRKLAVNLVEDGRYDDPEGREDARQRRSIDRELDIYGNCKKCGRGLDRFDHYAQMDREGESCFVCPKCGNAKYISRKDLDRIASICNRR